MNRFISLLLASVLLIVPASAAGAVTTYVSCTLIVTHTSSYNPDCGFAASLAALCPEDGSVGNIYSDNCFTIFDYKGSESGCLKLCESLEAFDCVECVEPDSEITLTAFTDDYFSDTQYSLNNTGTYTHVSAYGTGTVTSTADIDIDAPEGWDAYLDDPLPKHAVTVAVIDTGIDYKHPDLADAMWTNPGEIPDNGIDDDGNGYIDDIFGWDFFNNDSTVCHYEYNSELNAYLSSPSDNDDHGTHCAGIIAAVINNDIGIAGVASVGDVSLMSLKIHGGSDRSGSISDAIKAIRYAEMMGASVCNISWGSYTYSSALFTAIRNSNMLFVCAAGNDGRNNDYTPLYPASFSLDNVISVTFVDENGELAYDSNYGRKSVDIAVPAVDIFSTVVGTYSVMGGSSMAAPHVSGIAALLYTFGSGLFASNVRDVILAGVKPIPDYDVLFATGGIASLYRTMLNSGLLLYDNDPPDFSVSITYRDGNIVLNFNPVDNGASGISSIRYLTGKRSIDSFGNGSAGTVISDNELPLAKAGTYSVFLNDHAGNACLRTLRIPDDIVAPVIDNVHYTVNTKMTKLTLYADVSDLQSGLKTVKILKGRRTVADFKSPSVAAITPDESGGIKYTVTEEGLYTIYACDNRGNTSLSFCSAYIRRAASVALSRSKKTLYTGSVWSIGVELIPSRSTDRLSFSSSDESIAKVSSKGKITALSAGKCTITVTTSSGKTAKCKITVKDRAPVKE